MTKYWERVLQEILNKNDPTYEFIYTHRKSSVTRKQKNKKVGVKKMRVFYLGKRFSDVYFTGREAECMRQVLKGKTNNKVALALNLSPRTVEFYIDKMKSKLKCRSKPELIEKVLESDFMKHAE